MINYKCKKLFWLMFLGFTAQLYSMEGFHSKLVAALNNKDLPLFKTLVNHVVIETGTINYDKLTDRPSTLLHATAQVDFIEGTEFLLEQGASTEVRDFHDNTPLHFAACHASLDHIKLLLRYGADPLALNSYKEDYRIAAFSSVLHLASYYDRPAIIDFFLQQGVSIDHGNSKTCTPLFVALVTGKIRSFKLLLQKSLLSHESANNLIILAIKVWPLAFDLFDRGKEYFINKKEAFKIMLDYCDVQTLRKTLSSKKLLTLDEIWSNEDFKISLAIESRNLLTKAKEHAMKLELSDALTYLAHYEENIKRNFVTNARTQNITRALLSRQLGFLK